MEQLLADMTYNSTFEITNIPSITQDNIYKLMVLLLFPGFEYYKLDVVTLTIDKHRLIEDDRKISISEHDLKGVDDSKEFYDLYIAMERCLNEKYYNIKIHRRINNEETIIRKITDIYKLSDLRKLYEMLMSRFITNIHQVTE